MTFLNHWITLYSSKKYNNALCSKMKDDVSRKYDFFSMSSSDIFHAKISLTRSYTTLIFQLIIISTIIEKYARQSQEIT